MTRPTPAECICCGDPATSNAPSGLRPHCAACLRTLEEVFPPFNAPTPGQLLTVAFILGALTFIF